MLPLRDELERRQIPIRVANMPNSQWDGAVGRFMFAQICLAAQYQRDVDSERMTGLTRTIFEGGGHRGADPYGYVTLRDEHGRVAKPRTLAIRDTEAAVVRRVWKDLATKSTRQIASELSAEGVARRVPGPWTKNTVKDIVERGRFYLGYVVYKRGREEMPGRHDPIIDEVTWAAGRRAADARVHGKRERGSRRRVYQLASIITCPCGCKLRGETRMSRGQEWRYYLCRECGRSSVPAMQAEADVIARVREMILPAEAVEEARALLRQRLALPSRGMADETRAKLSTRIKKLVQLFEWDDIPEPEYLAKVSDARIQLALLPDHDKVRSFDDVARIVASLADALAAATPDQIKQLLSMVIQEVTTKDRTVDEIRLRPEAMPFFGSDDSDLVLAPPDGLGGSEAKAYDALAWYASPTL